MMEVGLKGMEKLPQSKVRIFQIQQQPTQQTRKKGNQLQRKEKTITQTCCGNSTNRRGQVHIQRPLTTKCIDQLTQHLVKFINSQERAEVIGEH